MTTLENVLNAIDALQHTKRERYKDGYRMNNPFDSSSDSKSFCIFNISGDGEFANFKYFAGGDGGTLYDLAKMLGAEIVKDQRANVETSKREYNDIADYAEAHAVPLDYLKRCRWEQTTYSNRPALKFYTAGGYRYRFLDNGKNKYTSDTGYTICWYGLEDAINKADQQGLNYIILCNGEISTVTAKYWGLPAFCQTSGENIIQPELLAELLSRWDKDIIIALDCDKAGRTATDKIAKQLKDKSKPVDLMLSDGGDLADYCKLNREDALKNLIALADQQNKPGDQPPAGQPPEADQQGINHYTEENRSDKVLADVIAELKGEKPIRQASFLFPIRELRQFGGFAELCETGKITLIAGGSGTGKTQLLETMNDKLNLAGVSGLWFGAEWRADEMQWRRIQRWSTHLNLTPITYDDIRRHRLYLKHAKDQIPEDENIGIRLSADQLQTLDKITPFLKDFGGYTEYFKDGLSIQNIFDNMMIAIDRERKQNREILYVIFDYVQLLKAKSPDSSVNRYEHAFEMVKSFATEANVHVFMTSQVNKVSQQDLSNGQMLSMESAHFVRGDKANLFLTLNRQYYKRDEEYIETPAFYLNIVKASLGGRPEGYTEPYLRIPLVMNPRELQFITSFDWRKSRSEPFIYLKDNVHYQGDLTTNNFTF